MKDLVLSVVAAYPDDPSKPSVVMSYVDDRFYMSVVRYRERFGQGKQVVCKATGETLDAAAEELRRKHDELMAGRELLPTPTFAADAVRYCQRHDLCWCAKHAPKAGDICHACTLAPMPEGAVGCCVCNGLYKQE